MKKFSSLSLALSLAVATVAVPMQAHAEMAKSERQAANAVQFRQAVFQLVRSNMGPLGAMAKGQIPFDKAVIQTNALRLEQLGMMVPDYFATNTTEFSVETEALPKIWSEKDEFLSKANDLTVAAKALQVAAQGDDEGAYRAAIGKVGGTCKGCHDAYKAD